MNAPAGRLAVFIDYSVLDHLHRVESATYKGTHEQALRLFRSAAEAKRLDLWMSEITPVEMLLGRENVADDPSHEARATENDARKTAIAEAMHVRTLGYPCTKLGDEYSRIGMSFRLSGDDSRPYEFEEHVGQIQGVSVGDARQLVTCAFPFDGEKVSEQPTLDWLIAEDGAFVAAVQRVRSSPDFPELAHLSVGNVAALVIALPALFY